MDKIVKWRKENDNKFFRITQLEYSIFFVLPKYNHEEFRLIEPLSRLPLSFVCEEYVKDYEAQVVCNFHGQEIRPFWISVGVINAKFVCDIDGSFITVKAKKVKGNIRIIIHRVCVLRQGNSFSIEKEQILNVKENDFFDIKKYCSYFKAARVVIDKLKNNKKIPCFVLQ